MALKEIIEAATHNVEVMGFDKTSFIIAFTVLGITTWNIYSYFSNYIDLPTVGVPPGILGPWRASINYFTKPEITIREGFAKHASTGGMFKIASLARWLVVVTDPKHIDEMNRAPEDVLSFTRASRKIFSAEFTVNIHPEEDIFTISIIQKQLTQQLATTLNDIVEETTIAFEENVKVGNDWTRVKIWDAILQVILSTTNRAFVGLPLCRNKEYMNICHSYTTAVAKAGVILGVAPGIIRPFLSWYLLNRPRRLKEVQRFVGPIFEERRKKLQTLGDKWTDRPNDAIQWILEAAKGTWMDNIELMTMQILFLNFVATHTTSVSVTHALFDLAANPHFITPIREEIEAVLAEDGWSTKSFAKMKKLDSALKESQRMNSILSMTMTREVQKPFQFSGSKVRLPVGAFVCAPAAAIHYESTIYENPYEYDAFRFSRMREQEGQLAKHQMVSTADNFLAFGLGKHACPGRFFAANQLKLLMAYIIRNYEFKFEDTREKRPANLYFDSNCVPDTTVELMFRKIHAPGK